MNKSKLLSTLGLALRAQQLISGEEFSCELIRKQRAFLVLLASDAGKNTTKKILDKAAYYGVKVYRELTTAEISQAIGKQNRKVVAITGKDFAQLLESAINE